MGVAAGVTYSEIQDWAADPNESDGRFSEIVTEVETGIGNAAISLQDVRTLGSALNTTFCEANVLFKLMGGKNIPITYTLQPTDDGGVYVEVSGFE
jgi:hypothetical protein